MELRPRSGSLAASASFQTDPGSFGDGHSKLIRKHFTLSPTLVSRIWSHTVLYASPTLAHLEQQLNFTEPQFVHLPKGANNAICLADVLRLPVVGKEAHMENCARRKQYYYYDRNYITCACAGLSLGLLGGIL